MRCILFQQSFQQLQFDFLKALVFRNKQDIIENEKSKKSAYFGTMVGSEPLGTVGFWA